MEQGPQGLCSIAAGSLPAGRCAGRLNRSVIVAMSAVRMVKMTSDQEIDVVAVRDRFVTAAGPVLVLALMAPTIVIGRASLWIPAPDLDHVFVDVAVMGMMQVAIMQVVDMIAMPEGDMATIGAMGMGMVLMDQMLLCSHDYSPSR